MKTLLKTEELAQFLACVVALFACNAPWWCYLLLLIGPDISMLGYLVSTQIGAFCYNLFHHKGVATLLIVSGFHRQIGMEVVELLLGQENETSTLLLTGLIMYGHSCMDRIFGYGLKFGDSFKHTHLGWIGGK